MAKGIRLQPIVSQKAADKIKAVSEENGESISTIINRLIIMQLANPSSGATSSPTTSIPKLPISTLRANLKGVRDTIATKQEQRENLERKGLTITFAQQDEFYDLYEKAAQIKQQLGELMDTTPDEVMQDHYIRELNILTQQHEAEADDLFNPETTPEFHKIYKERAERINTLKDRLK